MVSVEFNASVPWCDFSLAINKPNAAIDSSKSNGVQFVPSPEALDLVQTLCERFPLVVHQLRQSCRDHEPFEIRNEYGVQHIFHALLKLHFDDIIAEATTPTYAGGSAKIDFLLRSEKIGVETKMTRNGLDAKKLGDELIEDIARYGAHSDCKTLICFVYDPERLIDNPIGIENDLNKLGKEIEVHVFIRPLLA